MPTNPRLLSTCFVALVLTAGCPTEDTGGFVRSTPAAGIRGVICTPDGVNEVYGANVALFNDADEDGQPDDSSSLAVAITDIAGGFLLEGIGGGTYVAEVRKGHRTFSFPVVSTGGIQQRLERTCFPGDSAAVAVIEGTCDDPNLTLEGLGYQSEQLGEDELGLLTNPAEIAAFDVVMAPCGMPTTWMPQAETVAQTINDFIAGGGALYVSGDAWPLLEALDPELVDWVGEDEEPTAANVGFGATVQGRVTDDGLSEALGGALEIVYSNNWSMIEAAGEDWGWLASGTVQTLSGQFYEDAPLAMTLRGGQGSGSVTYSTFGSTDATPGMRLVLGQWLTEL